MSSVPTTSIDQPTVLGLISESDHSASDAVTRFVQLAASAQKQRLQKGSGKYAEVTRSTALWCLTKLDEKIAKALEAAMDPDADRSREETLGDLVSLDTADPDMDATDVAVHDELARALRDYLERLAPPRTVQLADLALAILVDARDHGGKLAERLDELRIDVKRAVELVGQPIKALPSTDVKLIADAPADVDLLDREGFANVLARMIRQQRSPRTKAKDSARLRAAKFGEGPILIQLYGAWGSGKTSFTGLVRRSLEQPRQVIDEQGIAEQDLDRWLFVTFDAWKHQRTAPPWWWLMDRVYREAKDRDHFGDPGRNAAAEAKVADPKPRPYARIPRWRIWRWRWETAIRGGLVLLIVGVAAAWLRTNPLDWLPGATELVRGIVALLAALGASYGLYQGVRGSLMVGSPRAASALLRSGGDPLRRVHDKFRDLIWVINLPVLVFIDNLDRCQPGYVVELLEGIQSIFADVEATYLIAADQEWVAHSFERQYADLAGVMGQPGRPLGYLFLEKIFAVSAALPHASEVARTRYWQAVLSDGHVDVQQVSPEDRRQATEEVRRGSVDTALGTVQKLSPDDQTPKARAIREAVAIRFVEATTGGERDHELRPYLRFLEPNPRALKRLRNAVSIARAAQLTSGVPTDGDNDLDALVRWTILTLRWPQLAVTLTRQPALAAALCNPEASAEKLSENMAMLSKDRGLHRLLTEPIDGHPTTVVQWIAREYGDDQLDVSEKEKHVTRETSTPTPQTLRGRRTHA